MRTVLRIAVIASLAVPALIWAGCQPALEPEAAAPAAPSDEEMLHQLGSDFEAAWAQGDAAGIAALWTEDGDSMRAGSHFMGRSAIEESYRQDFEGPLKGASIDIEMTSVRHLQPDVAVADGTYEITGIKGPEGEDLPATKGLWMNVNMKVGDKWYIACSRPMVPLEAPETPEG